LAICRGVFPADVINGVIIAVVVIGSIVGWSQPMKCAYPGLNTLFVFSGGHLVNVDEEAIQGNFVVGRDVIITLRLNSRVAAHHKRAFGNKGLAGWTDISGTISGTGPHSLAIVGGPIVTSLCVGLHNTIPAIGGGARNQSAGRGAHCAGLLSVITGLGDGVSVITSFPIRLKDIISTSGNGSRSP
jgi:hypothetical protein